MGVAAAGRAPAASSYSGDHQLRFELFPALDAAGFTNLNVYGAIWRWVRGFHAALYGEFIPAKTGRGITSPFVRDERVESGLAIEPMKEPQHRDIVETIKTNRAKTNLDLVHTCGGKMRYECVWKRSDEGEWVCFFALEIYGWKDLGRTSLEAARGCAGFYLASRVACPTNAATAVSTPILVPNLDPLDAFGP